MTVGYDSCLTYIDIFIAFLAIGHIAQVVGSDMKTFLEPIMANVKEAFTQRGYVLIRIPALTLGSSLSTLTRKKNAPEEETIFQCIGMLAAAVGSNLTKLLHDILDLMFAYGLSEHLRHCLTHISVHIPPLLGAIQGIVAFVFVTYLDFVRKRTIWDKY